MKDVMIWEKFDTAVEKLFQLTSGKTIVLWGYGYGGWFVEHLFRRKNKQIEYIVDENDSLKKAYNPYFIRRLDPDTTVVLVTFSANAETTKYLEDLGFKEDRNFCYVKKLFFNEEWKEYLSYNHYLEKEFHLDITRPLKNDALLPNMDGHVHAPSVDYSLIDVVDNLMWKEEDALFDFGCGKGSALLLLTKTGIRKLGGVEYDKNLYNILLENFNKVKCSTESLFRQDAAKLKEEIDEYNYFYMYDPFEGDTFYQVICNIDVNSQKSGTKICS